MWMVPNGDGKSQPMCEPCADNAALGFTCQPWERSDYNGRPIEDWKREWQEPFTPEERVVLSEFAGRILGVLRRLESLNAVR